MEQLIWNNNGTIDVNGLFLRDIRHPSDIDPFDVRLDVQANESPLTSRCGCWSDQGNICCRRYCMLLYVIV